MSPSSPETMYVTVGLNGGGAERLLTNLVLQAPDRDRISVVSLYPGGEFRRALQDAAVRVSDLNMTRNRDAVRGLFALAKLMRERRPTIVYGWQYHANILAMLALILAGQPRTPLFWGLFSTDICRGGLHLIFRLVRRISALLSRWTTAVIYNAEEARDYHRSIGYWERKSVVISNCIDRSVFQPDARQRGSLRSELAIGANDVVVAMAARVHPMKDWRTVREAVRDLPGVIMLAIGNGTDQLPPQPGFIGLGWRADVVRILNASDIFLLGSAFGEGTPLAVEEAMHCGLPCIVTDVGGNAALTRGAGIVVPPGDSAAIRDAIIQLVNDPARREELGRAAREIAVAADSCHETLQRLEQLAVAREATS
jgi:glycosyltransferase involved in cell wall biosynthesis